MATGTAGTSARYFHTAQTHYLIKQVLEADDGTQISMGYIPAGSMVVRAYARVTEAFNDGGTDYINIGTAADPDGFCNDLDVSSTGLKEDSSTFNACDDAVVTADTEIVVQYDGANSDATAGVAYAVVEYVVDPVEVTTLT